MQAITVTITCRRCDIFLFVLELSLNLACFASEKLEPVAILLSFCGEFHVFVIVCSDKASLNDYNDKERLTIFRFFFPGGMGQLPPLLPLWAPMSKACCYHFSVFKNLRGFHTVNCAIFTSNGQIAFGGRTLPGHKK